jgi:hypothetical protein
MADPQSTPAPWRVAYLDRNGQRVVKGEHIEIATCWHHSVGAIEKEMEMNARLIAAAPDMLEALRAAEGHLEEMRQDRKWHPIEHCPVLDQVRRAIAKAAGVMSDLPQSADTLEDARTLALHYQSIAAEQGSKIIRLRIALQIIREFGGFGNGFHGGVTATMTKWMDNGMDGPVPWPESVFFDTWAASKGDEQHQWPRRLQADNENGAFGCLIENLKRPVLRSRSCSVM